MAQSPALRFVERQCLQAAELRSAPAGGLLTIRGGGGGGFIISAAFPTLWGPAGVSKNSFTFVMAVLQQHFLYFLPNARDTCIATPCESNPRR